MKRSHIIWISSVFTLLLLVLFSVVTFNIELKDLIRGKSTQTLSDLPPEFDRLGEIWNLLQQEHVDRDTINADVLSEGAVRGLLQALDDPYASYLNAEQFQMESADYQGFFEGIGAQVTMRDGQLMIIAPMPGSPAEKSGIKPGDQIMAINGKSTENITLLEAVSTIRGKKGTNVDLLILHVNATESLKITVTRGVIPLASLNITMSTGGIGHLQIFSFGDKTNEELHEALETFRSAQGRGLMLDLRNNPGGMLHSVVDIASNFLDRGLVLYEIDGQGNRKDWEVKNPVSPVDMPMVVLVNEFSASASEVLTGALMDHKRAKVLGVTTFGKGSVNTLRQLSDGSGLYFTVGRWYTPLGTMIEGEGVTPDILVEIPEGSMVDVQLQKGIEILESVIMQVK